ncbi:hypothetical protein TRFO_24550 [Tritrichomonas foetus]|uniref:CUE domain-containing protein n=1 Tax=Tritrichomonas foetus TaxID=1144522 RepID=A0A1J4K8T8_9EUKA|nr:hypothetical protein TRFO_24550 [Tritrichomonas foetus]|eukprot:OHT07296.1 hypothetical protein TRFO_24550 [Tritrichomonas foetus]
MDEDVDFIKMVLPNADERNIIRTYEETNNIDETIQRLNNSNSPKRKKKKTSKRIVVSVHSECSEFVIDGITEAVKSVRSLSVESSEFAPQNTISVSFQEKPCKPMIYVEPTPLDPHFCTNVEPHSIILTHKYDDIEIKVSCSFNSLVLLPLTKDNISLSLRQVLIENGIIGDGYGTKLYGDLWNEMLKCIPSINSTYADAISKAVPTPYDVAYNFPEQITTKDHAKVPRRILDTLKLFYTSDDPNERLETGPRKRNNT